MAAYLYYPYSLKPAGDIHTGLSREQQIMPVKRAGILVCTLIPRSDQFLLDVELLGGRTSQSSLFEPGCTSETLSGNR